jgi:hypothetical protein
VVDAVVEGSERLAVVEIRGVDDVSDRAELVGKREEPGRLSLRMVKEQYVGHGERGYPARGAEPRA